MGVWSQNARPSQEMSKEDRLTHTHGCCSLVWALLVLNLEVGAGPAHYVHDTPLLFFSEPALSLESKANSLACAHVGVSVIGLDFYCHLSQGGAGPGQCVGEMLRRPFPAEQGKGCKAQRAPRAGGG